MRWRMSSRRRLPSGGGHRLSQGLPRRLERSAFHGRPQRLASRALPHRAGPLRRSRSPTTTASPRPSSPTTRRSTASTLRRCCGGSNSRASTSATRWAPVAESVDGACRRSRARLQRSASRARRGALAGRRTTSSACAARSTITRASASATTGRSRSRSAGALIDGVIAFGDGDYAAAIDASFRCATRLSASAAATLSATSSP